MTAFNTMRFRVKPGREQEFLDAHKRIETSWPGLLHVNMIKTGDRSYCIIARQDDGTGYWVGDAESAAEVFEGGA